MTEAQIQAITAYISRTAHYYHPGELTIGITSATGGAAEVRVAPDGTVMLSNGSLVMAGGQK